MAQPDANTQKQVQNCQEQIAKLEAQLQDPSLSPEEKAKVEQSLANQQAKLQRLQA